MSVLQRSPLRESRLYYTLAIDLIGQLRRDVIGRLSVKLNLLLKYFDSVSLGVK